VAALESQVSSFGDRIDIGTLTVAIMLDYLDFRFAHEPWREAHPRLAQWHQAVSARPSLKATMPAD
jgi:glutathione S-transferase